MDSNTILSNSPGVFITAAKPSCPAMPKTEPWRALVAGAHFPSRQELSKLANSGARSDIRLLKELDAKSR